MKRELNQDLSGKEVCETNYPIFLVKNMLCSELHCQKGFKLIPFSYKIQAADYDPIIRSQLASTQWFLGPYVV